MNVIRYIIALGLLPTLTLAAEETTRKKSFYFDEAAKKYYTDGQAGFSIRPVGKADYLEKIEVSVNDGGFSTYTGTLKLEKEGHYNIRFRAVDPVLNWSPVQIYDIYVDRTPPVTRWTWKGDFVHREGQTYVHPQAKLVLSGEDALSGVDASWMISGDGKPTPITQSLSFPAGTHAIKFYSTDRVGNQENAQELKFTVDGKPPVTDVEISGQQHRVGDRLYVHFDSRLNLKSADDASGVKRIEYQINAGPVIAYSAPIAVSEKQLSLKYRGIDAVGNTEDWKTITVLEDSQAPRLSLKEEGRFISAHGKTYAKPGYKVKISGTDAESGIQSITISRDGKNFTPTEQTEIAFEQTGDYLLHVRAADHLGNMTEANPLIVHIDNTAPTTTPRFTENTVMKENTYLVALPNRLHFDAADTGAGVERIEYSYDGKTYQTLREAIDVSTWQNTEQTVYYRASDRVGNLETAKVMKVKLLTDGPMVGLFIEAEGHAEVPLSKFKNEAPRSPANKQPK